MFSQRANQQADIALRRMSSPQKPLCPKAAMPAARGPKQTNDLGSEQV